MREHNWANTYVLKAARILRPTSIDDVRRIVAGSPKLRAIGTRHSFNGIADSPGELIDLGGLDPGIEIDPASKTVTVAAGTSYAVLAQHMQARGWALHNMASLPHISIAGAVTTGTHGSGDKSGSLATAVAGIELVAAGGDLVNIRRGDAGFDGMVVGLGAFGIVTRMTLDIEPSFDVRQDAFAGLPWTTALANLDAIMSAAHSVSVMTMWSSTTVGRLWLKTRLVDGAPAGAIPAPPGATATAQVTETVSDDIASQLNVFGVAGPWSDRLPHYQRDVVVAPIEQIQSEYMVPRAQGVAALARLRAIGDRIDPHLYMSEIRTVAADGLWLSSSYGHDCLAIHFTWKKEPDAVHAITAEIEALLLPLGARPHWGKVIHAGAAELAPLYPRLPAFRELARSYDPEGKFRNEFLETHVFG